MKRYRVQVLLKKPVSLQEIAEVNHKVIALVKHLNIVRNKAQEMRWLFQPARIVFCHFGLDMDDISNNNNNYYCCCSTWVDKTQDKAWWYRSKASTEIINDICFDFPDYYTFCKKHLTSHTGSVETLVPQTRLIVSNIVTLMESAIKIYNEHSDDIPSQESNDEMLKICCKMDRLYYDESNLDVPPSEIKEWCQCCTNLVATIHDISLYYRDGKRTAENRKACIDLTIKRYYEDLEKLKQAEKNTGNLLFNS